MLTRLVTASTTAATINNTSSINNNIDAVASSSANASTLASTTASTGNHTQRAASSKLPPNRSKGSKNYSRDEVEHLLKSVSICLPLGSEDWQVVAHLHAEIL